MPCPFFICARSDFIPEFILYYIMGYGRTILVSSLVLLCTGLFYMFSVFVPLPLNTDKEVAIRRGLSYDETLTLLKRKGLIRDGFILSFLGRVLNLDGRIKSGYYRFSGSVTPFKVLSNLVKGRVEEVSVTIPEGFNLRQIAKRLGDSGIIDENSFFSLAYDRGFLNSLGIKAPSLEGYLFPDTYRFPKGASGEYVIREMVENMRRQFNKKMRTRAEAIGFSEREVLTLASIIEKETGLDDERPVISAVFHNRLRRGMPLQADPTAVYGVKDQSAGITLKDLKRKSAYNTYQIRGLPAGPIASPGLKSIRAALFPADVPYLYFVSESNGRHYFSITESEHRRAVQRFRAKRHTAVKRPRPLVVNR